MSYLKSGIDGGRQGGSLVRNRVMDIRGDLATGGKLLGAGGGGFFIFYVHPFKKYALMTYLESINLTIQPFRFEPDGLKAWVSRDNSNRSIGE